MTFADLPPAEQRAAAWRDLPWACRFCGETQNHRCVTSSGARTIPHGARMADIASYMAGRESRDAEVNTLAESVNKTAQHLTDAERALALMTTERDDLRISLAASLLEVTGLTEQVSILTHDLEATRAERDALRGRVNELTGEVDGLQSVIDDMDDELDDLQRRYDDHMSTHQPGGTRLLIGAAVGGNSDPAPLEAALGHVLALRRTYYGHSLTERTKALTTIGNDHKMGRTPFVSFKTPHSWADMAAGKGDAWALDIGEKLAETRKRVWVVIHHEPEGDGPIADWVAMQRRLLPLLASEHVKVGICLTGYSEVTGGTPSFDQVWPGDMAQFLSVDIYQRYGTTDAGLKWTPLDEFYGLVAAFAKGVGVPWGLGETGVTDEAMAANPKCLDDLFATARKHGAEHLCYFNSALNSKGSWPLSGPKLTAFVNQAPA